MNTLSKSLLRVPAVWLGAVMVAASAYAQPFGYFDSMNPSSASASSTITGNGWAADDVQGAPVSRVEIRVDGQFQVEANRGGDRGDVANAFGRSDFEYSGWSFSFSASSLSSGNHELTAWAQNDRGDWSQLSNTWTVNVAANQSPSVGISVDGHGWGDTIPRTTGSSVGVTVHYTASDPDGNLQGIRYNIWHQQSGYFDNGGGGFTDVGGGGGDLTKSFSLDQDGDWYFWTDAQDTAGAYSSTGDWGNGFHIIVNHANTPPYAVSVRADDVTVGATTTFYGRGTDIDGDLTTLLFFRNPPNWAGWQPVNPPATSAPTGDFSGTTHWDVASSEMTGTWQAHVRAVDSTGAWDWNGGQMSPFTVSAANHAPVSSLSASATNITLGQSITLTSTITDVDNNLVNQAVDISTDNANWTSGWDNWSGQTAWNISGGSATNTVTYTPPQARTYYFRSRGIDSANVLSDFATVTVTVTPSQPTYTLTVQNGTGSQPSGIAGSPITITAGAAPSGQMFSSWSLISGPGTFGNAGASVTTFTMGSGNATVTANFVTIPQPPQPTVQPELDVHLPLQ